MVQVSVVILWNGDMKSIKRCLYSIENQTLKEIEIIILKQNSKEVLGLYENISSKLKDRIKLLCCEDMEHNQMLNMGVDTCKGKYIMFLHSNNTLDLSTLEDMSKLAELEKADCVVCNVMTISSKQRKKKVMKPSHFIYFMDEQFLEKYKSEDEALLGEYLCNKMFRKDIIRIHHLRFQNDSKETEFLFSLDYLSKSTCVYGLDESCCYCYVE